MIGELTVGQIDMDTLEELWSRSNEIDDFDGLLLELQRFLSLTNHTDQPMAVLGKRIDELWHSFISCTELYEEYCDRNFGEFIHHRPNTAKHPVPISASRTFVTAYQQVYGEVPAAWFEGVPPEVVAFAKGKDSPIPETYRWSGWPGRAVRSKHLS